MIITLCGSLKFEEQFKEWDERLTLQGHTVFTVSVYPSVKAGVKNWYSEETKLKLDAAHFRKIEVSDAILVIDTDGYIGESTKREIAHATELGKQVFYTHRFTHTSNNVACWYKGCGDSIRNRPPCALCYE